MHSLRSLLCGLYAFVGVTLLFGVCSLLLNGLRSYSSEFSLLALCAEAFLPLCSFLFLIAAVSYWMRWRSARIWCILVGVLNLAVPFFVGYFVWRYGHEPISAALGQDGLLLGLGATGIFAFWRWDPAMETGAQNPATTSAQQGDGTNSFLNRTHTIAIYIAFAAIWMAWGQWAYRQGMPVLPFWESFLQVTIADLAVITLHECGHTLCGVALGQKVLAFMAGPFQWRKHAGHWKFSFNLMGLLTTGGGTAVVPQQLGEPKWREFCMISAGPLVSFVTGIAGLWVLLKTQSSSLESLWFPLAMFGSISLVTAIANLIPLRTSTGFSDGARIYQLLRGGPWADLHEVYKITAATTVTSLRPRDYNIKAIHRVFAAGIVTGPAELLLHLLARSYYLDIGRPGEADLQLNEAEKIYDECAEQISPNLLPSFVVGESLMRRDAARARLWWDRMEAKRPTWLNGDYWMARSALCVVEGNLDEGWAAWAKAQEYLRSMPEAGTYAFDRELLEVLKRAIETESSTTSRVSMA